VCAIWLAAGFAGRAQSGARSVAGAQASPQREPVLKLRPPLKPGVVREPPGQIRLDVVVTDASGKPVAGLGAEDFELLDESQPQPIVSFAAQDGLGTDVVARTSILLVIDAVNAGISDLSFLREDAAQFLRQNDGHLAQPVTVILLHDDGFHVVGRSSTDGDALAKALEDFKPNWHTTHTAVPGAQIFSHYQRSLRALSVLVEREMDEPGRKLAIWMGPGWSIPAEMETPSDTHSQSVNFDTLAMLSNHLRKARMVVCSAGGGSEESVHDLLKPVKKVWQQDFSSMALPVIAVHSGGRTLGSGKNGHTVSSVNACAEQAGAYYSLSFKAPASARVFTYHALRVIVSKPGLTARTNSGYYSEP
jgi:VWFA-related protein